MNRLKTPIIITKNAWHKLNNIVDMKCMSKSDYISVSSYTYSAWHNTSACYGLNANQIDKRNQT